MGADGRGGHRGEGEGGSDVLKGIVGVLHLLFSGSKVLEWILRVFVVWCGPVILGWRAERAFVMMRTGMVYGTGKEHIEPFIFSYWQ